MPLATPLPALLVIIENGGCIFVQAGESARRYSLPLNAADVAAAILLQGSVEPYAVDVYNDDGSCSFTDGAEEMPVNAAALAKADPRDLPRNWRVWPGDKLGDPAALVEAALRTGWPTEGVFLTALADQLAGDADLPAPAPLSAVVEAVVQDIEAHSTWGKL